MHLPGRPWGITQERFEPRYGQPQEGGVPFPLPPLGLRHLPTASVSAHAPAPWLGPSDVHLLAYLMSSDDSRLPGLTLQHFKSCADPGSAVRPAETWLV